MTKDVTETTAMPKPAARHARPAAEAPRPSEGSGYDPTPEPLRKKNNVLIIVLVAAVLILVLLFALSLCTKHYTADVKTKEEETEIVEPTATEEPESTETEEQTTPIDEEGETEVTPTGSRAGGPASDISDATIESWSNKARSFLVIYPVNHILAGGSGDEPSSMSIEDWATNCLRYVDESSNFGQALRNDPESIAETLGFYEVASYVSDTSVVSVDAMGVTVAVTIQGTQMDWDHTSEVVENFLVQFNDDGEIVNAVVLNG